MGAAVGLCPGWAATHVWTMSSFRDPCAQDLVTSVGGFVLLSLLLPVLVWLQRRRTARFNTEGCVLTRSQVVCTLACNGSAPVLGPRLLGSSRERQVLPPRGRG